MTKADAPYLNKRRLSYHHRGGDEPLLWATIPDHLRAIAERFPDHDAIVSCHQNKRLSYRDVRTQSDAVAKGLLALGFAKGERIGVWATDQVEWLLLQLATARIGVVLVNINPAYRPRELEYALQKSQVQGLFVMPRFKSSDYLAMLKELDLPGPRCPDLRRIFVFDPQGESEDWRAILDTGKAVTDAQLDAVSQTLDPDDAINIQYTSGTTGFPKAVVLSHFNILNNALFSAHAMRFTERDRLCVPVPFYHCFGMVLANLLCMSVGAAIVVPSEHFDALAVLQSIEVEKCTALHGVPTMFIAELEHPEFSAFDLSTLRTGIMAGAPCPEALMKRVMRDMHLTEILIGYGQTEASPLTHLTNAGDSIELRTQTVGRNLPHQEVKIINPDSGATLPTDEVGEVCFRGYHIMQGYYGDADATAKAIDPAGWLHSGDLGTMDANGYVRITGRIKDMIIRGGENIYPAEIEAWLYEHPAIAQAAVFGVPDARMGEEIMAWIELHAGQSLSEDDVKAYCREGLAHFKVPHYVEFVDEFPMTVTGKLQKFRMREIAAAKLAAAHAV
ncbi:AMP-binding protein [Magnetovibrio sp.]|uniref:AMP-binding protein n=1 Tax=Magnetovibrio sp. TaxID=2024836 RepID=UPI002F950C4C